MSVRYDKRSKSHLVRIRRHGLPEISRTFKRKSDADAFDAKTRKEIFEQKDLGRKARHTLGAAVERYLLEEVAHQRSADRTESNIRALLPDIDGLYLDQIDLAVKRVKASVRVRGKETEPLKPATINRRLAILRRVANLAYKDWHWLDREYAVRLLPEHNKRHEYLSIDEIEQLSAACLAPVNHWVLIASYSGIRRGEMLAVDETSIRGNNLFLGLTKNGKPILLPITPKVKKALDAWIKAEKPHPRTLHKYFKQGAAKIGRPDLRPHDMRHTTASLILNAGYGLETVAEVLNCTIQNAQRYAHLSMENKRNAMLEITKKQGRTKKSGVKLAVNANAGSKP
jgi:integrase